MTERRAEPRDPLRTFRFRVKVGDTTVAGVQKVSGLSVTVGARETWEGGNALHRYANPDRTTWEPVSLHQGLALGNTLEEWALAVVEFLRTGKAPEVQVKRDVTIEVLGNAFAEGTGFGEAPSSYRLRNAWVSRYEAVPALDALSNEVALITLQLTHEGWKPTTQG